MQYCQQKLCIIIDNQSNLEENMPNWIVITVLAGALAPNGARASASTVMINFVFHMYMGPALGESSDISNHTLVNPLRPSDAYIHQ